MRQQWSIARMKKQNSEELRRNEQMMLQAKGAYFSKSVKHRAVKDREKKQRRREHGAGSGGVMSGMSGINRDRDMAPGTDAHSTEAGEGRFGLQKRGNQDTEGGEASPGDDRGVKFAI
mmetsp:Transcript_11347/g.16229  ORF Transcript_11347/g.16229 Transcript_11347/m.16229 type:complete len:118 (+) Transcript_11347:235-588(+)